MQRVSRKDLQYREASWTIESYKTLFCILVGMSAPIVAHFDSRPFPDRPGYKMQDGIRSVCKIQISSELETPQI